MGHVLAGLAATLVLAPGARHHTALQAQDVAAGGARRGQGDGSVQHQAQSEHQHGALCAQDSAADQGGTHELLHQQRADHCQKGGSDCSGAGMDGHLQRRGQHSGWLESLQAGQCLMGSRPEKMAARPASLLAQRSLTAVALYGGSWPLHHAVQAQGKQRCRGQLMCCDSQSSRDASRISPLQQRPLYGPGWGCRGSCGGCAGCTEQCPHLCTSLPPSGEGVTGVWGLSGRSSAVKESSVKGGVCTRLGSRGMSPSAMSAGMAVTLQASRHASGSGPCPSASAGHSTECWRSRLL